MDYEIYLTDIDCDTGEVSQYLLVATVISIGYAKQIVEYLNTSDDEPSRTYDYKKV